MADEAIIKDTAEFWLEQGGDAEGWSYCQYRIYMKIKELEGE